VQYCGVTTQAAHELATLIGTARVVDLSHPLANGDPIFPGQEGFQMTRLNEVDNPDLPLCFSHLSFIEHCGTHMDAPAHVIQGGRYLDELEFGALVGPAVKVDVRATRDEASDYDVSLADLERFETAHGRIQPGTIVFLHTGWDARYRDPSRYVEVAEDGSWHWPGLAGDAAELLADRRVRGVGIDTIGLDGGHVAMTLAAHRAVLGTGAFIVENVANLDTLPATGALGMAFPIKTQLGSGGPTRVFALS
jgi:kynurenine formamidase